MHNQLAPSNRNGPIVVKEIPMEVDECSFFNSGIEKSPPSNNRRPLEEQCGKPSDGGYYH
jgi:hypothetical protein